MVAPPSTPPHWPGGIPREVQLDANGDIPRQQAFEEAKGWFLFVTERWIPRSARDVPEEDGDYEVRQRRELVVAWATASQEFRESYHQRAIERNTSEYPEGALDNCWYPGDSPRLLCLAPLGPSYQSNRSKWIKLYILSCRLDGELGHCLEHWGSNHGGIDPNPATFPDPSTVQIADVLPRAILEIADFRCMVMTRRGTVLFMDRLKPWFLVTAEDLNTGHITMVEFKRNGEVQASLRRRAYNFFAVYQHYSVDWKSLKAIEEDRVGGNWNQNGDVDMTLPIIDIMEGARERAEFLWGFDGERNGWTEDIEIYAPGYLEMEAAGAEANYDHAWLIDPERAYDIRRRMYEEELSRS